MHIKRMHEMIEKLTECTKSAIENDADKIGNFYIPDVVDMIKDLNEASYYASIVKAMDEAKKEDEEEEKYMMKMLKEDRADEYKRMREQYGDEEGERRFYDNYRYKSSGRFAPRGKGSYMPRRGYVEPPYYHMMPDMYDDYNAEEMRDLDRKSMNRMYYTPMSGNSGNMSGSSANSNGSNINSGGSRGYSDGYDEGQKRGYTEGYEQGNRDGKRSGGNSRYDNAKRGYEETKEAHKGNTPEDKQVTMREAEKMVNVFMDGLEEALEDSPIEVKNMVKAKATSRLQKMS